MTRQKKDRVTADDILDSLTRQVELKQKLGQNDSLRLEEIAGTEELIQFQGFNPETCVLFPDGKEEKLRTCCIRLHASSRTDGSVAVQFNLQAV